MMIIPVSPVATFEHSENVATAGGCQSSCLHYLAQAGYCLCMNYVSMFCEHVLLIDDRAC